MNKKYYINRHAEQLDMPYNDDDSQRLLQTIDEVVQTHEPESEEEVSRLVERLAFEWRISPTVLNLISQSYWRGYVRGMKDTIRHTSNEDLK